MGACLHGEFGEINLTGGMDYQEIKLNYISKMTSWIADIAVYPGEDELRALAYNGLRVIKGEATPLEYS